MNALQEERREGYFESLLRHFLAAFNGMRAIEQDFRLHNWYYPTLLTKRCIARQSVSIGFEAGVSGNAVADGDYRAPFSELGTKLLILFYSSPKSVESLGHDFAGKARNIYGAFVDFNTGHDALLREKLGERRAVQGRGSNGFVEKNYTADGLLDTFCREEHIAVGATVMIVGFDLDAVEASFDRTHTFVGCEDSFSLCHHRLSNGFKFLFGHVFDSSLEVGRFYLCIPGDASQAFPNLFDCASAGSLLLGINMGALLIHWLISAVSLLIVTYVI